MVFTNVLQDALDHVVGLVSHSACDAGCNVITRVKVKHHHDQRVAVEDVVEVVCLRDTN